MKIWIAWGALSIGLVVVALRPPARDTVILERRVEVPVKVETPIAVPQTVEKVRVETRTVEKPVPATPPSPRLERLGGTALAHEKMLFLFERELEMKADQRRLMEEVLARRELEIAEYQRSVVSSGVFRVREYDDRIRAIQNTSYERMAEVLDEAQRRRFTGLVAEGRMGDAVMFEVPPTLVVLQD